MPARVVPPAPHGEVDAVRDVGRLLRHGETFGASRIEIRMVPWPVVITSGRIAVGDALNPTAARTLARQVPPGRFRTMLSIAHCDGDQRIAAAVMHVGRPPIARWVVAHFERDKPPRSAAQPPTHTVQSAADAFMDAVVLDELRASASDPDAAARASLTAQLDYDADPTATGTWIADSTSGRNVVAFSSGHGEGAYASYWGLDATRQPVCLVTDFDLFDATDWRSHDQQ